MFQHKSIDVTQHTNRTEDKNHMNLSKGTERALDKTQCLFMIKTQKQGIEGKFLKIIKAMMKTAQLTLYSMVRKRNLSL